VKLLYDITIGADNRRRAQRFMIEAETARRHDLERRDVEAQERIAAALETISADKPK